LLDVGVVMVGVIIVVGIVMEASIFIPNSMLVCLRSVSKWWCVAFVPWTHFNSLRRQLWAVVRLCMRSRDWMK
jgi:hypothetical protein